MTINREVPPRIFEHHQPAARSRTCGCAAVGGINVYAPVVSYCTEEVRRQGHDVAALNGIRRVGWMLEAWAAVDHHGTPSALDIEQLGRMIERHKNAQGFRRTNVRVGPVPVAVHPDEVRPRLEQLLSMWDALEPLDLYRKFELIHPFADGDGRVGKILLNWRAGTLLTPFFPPADFWGTPLVNP